MNRHSFNAILLRRYGSKPSIYWDGDYSTPFFPAANAREVFAESVYGLDEILYSVTLETASETMAHVSLTIALGDQTWATWSKKYNSLYGVCYSLDIHEDMAKLGITEVCASSTHNIGNFGKFRSSFCPS